MAFVCGGFRVFDKINCYIALRSAGERVFCGYMRSAVLSQQCGVTTFGECVLFYSITRGRECDSKFFIAINRKNSASFSLNIERYVSRNIDPLIFRTV